MTIVTCGRYELLGYLEESENERNEGYDECDDRYWIGPLQLRRDKGTKRLGECGPTQPHFYAVFAEARVWL